MTLVCYCRYIDELATEGPCNIDIRDSDKLSQKEFEKVYAYSKPLIINNPKHWNEVSFVNVSSGFLSRDYGALLTLYLC